MCKFSGVLLASDYDDTLYDQSISRENRAAIRHFVEQGGLFTISTGRSYRNFAIQMEQEDLPVNAPVVLANGATIYDFQAEKLLWQRPLPLEASEHLAALCRAYPEVGVEAYHGERIYTYRANDVTRRHLKRCSLMDQPCELQEMPLPWIKVILQHPESAYLQRIQAELLATWGELYEVTFSNPMLLEVTAKGANKGTSVLRLAQHLGIQGENLYCVGNGLNDLPMLEVAAVPFAPADCYAELKDWGAVILPPSSEHCIASLIAHLEARY